MGAAITYRLKEEGPSGIEGYPPTPSCFAHGSIIHAWACSKAVYAVCLDMPLRIGLRWWTGPTALPNDLESQSFAFVAVYEAFFERADLAESQRHTARLSFSAVTPW